MAIKILTLLTLFTFLFFSTSVTSISTHDLDALLALLRANGHSLFANAISTSDLLFDLLSLPSLTLLAPTNPSLFALDMTQTPSFYLSTLRLHALPRRLSWSSFLLLPNGSSLPTLLPSRQLRLTRRDGANVVLVVSTIGGGAVQLVMPGLFYSSHVAVHGLAGILTFRFKTGGGGGGGSASHPNRTVFLPPVTRFPFTPPRIPEILPANRTNNHSSPVNCTVLSSLVPTDHVSPVNRTVVSPPVPTDISNHTYHVSPVLKHTVVSPRVNHSTVSPWPNPSDSSPAPVPGLDANGAPKLRKNGDVATGISSEFVVSPGGVENQKEW
ncbi:hypothetical protein Patl1_36918 [Pistacia atlantica]|nr:hypothetical protein Patl1_36918 [Pistacia atlantica]